MTKHYTVRSPDGHEYDVDAPDDASQQDVINHARQQHTQAATPATGPAPLRDIDEIMRKDPSQVDTAMAGLVQGGLLNLPEGIGQLIEHMTGAKLAPDFIRERLKSFRNFGRQTTAGQIAELGGDVGSMFLSPVGALGPLARAAGFVGRANRAAEAGRAGLQGVRSATQAGPIGYAAVRRAMETAGDVGKRAVRKGTTGPGAEKEMWTHPRDYFPEPPRGPVRPSQARPAFETPNPPPPVGPPGMAARARVAAEDAAAAVGRKVGSANKGLKVVAHRHPVVAGITRGAASAAGQPVEGARTEKEYRNAKLAQMAAGGTAGMFAASPLARAAAARLGTHAAIHGPAALLAPHHWGLHWPLHYLARSAGHMAAHQAAGRPVGAAGQRAAGAAAGWATGGSPVDPVTGRLHVSPNRENQND